MRVQFKFSKTSPKHERDELLSAIRQQGALEAEPLFAQETDPELASLFTAESPAEDEARKLLSTLERSSAVEFAEYEPERKLIQREAG